MSISPGELYWIDQQRGQAAAAAYAHLQAQFLLIGSGASGMVDELTDHETGRAPMKTYATLAIGRTRYKAVSTTIDGRKRDLNREQAVQHYQQIIVDAAEASYLEVLAKCKQRRESMAAGAIVREGVEIKRDSGKVFKEKAFVDEVIIDGSTTTVEPGLAADFIATYVSRAVPPPPKPDLPTYETWFDRNAKELRTWRAEFITAEVVANIELGDDLSWKWGFPLAAAARLLEQLAADGWVLLHVSEDRGLYTGEDTDNDSYPTRVKYLHGKP